MIKVKLAIFSTKFLFVSEIGSYGANLMTCDTQHVVINEETLGASGVAGCFCVFS